MPFVIFFMLFSSLSSNDKYLFNNNPVKAPVSHDRHRIWPRSRRTAAGSPSTVLRWTTWQVLPSRPTWTRTTRPQEAPAKKPACESRDPQDSLRRYGELDGDLAAVIPMGPFKIITLLVWLEIDIHADQTDGKRNRKGDRQSLHRQASLHKNKCPRRSSGCGRFLSGRPSDFADYSLTNQHAYFKLIILKNSFQSKTKIKNLEILEESPRRCETTLTKKATPKDVAFWESL